MEAEARTWFSYTKVLDDIWWLGFGVARWAIGFNVGEYLIILGPHKKPQEAPHA